MNIALDHIEKILAHYSKEEFYDELVAAKKTYMDLTGKLDEESEEYESRMNSFNDWFAFNYLCPDGKRIVEKYVEDFSIEEDEARALLNVNYSLFHFAKINFRKQVVLRDVLHQDKIVLPPENARIGLVENDIFVGRTMLYKDQNFILPGVCTLPREVLSILKKEAKKVKRLNDYQEEEKFLLMVERLKTKSLSYGHLDSSKIFIFPKQ